VVRSLHNQVAAGPVVDERLRIRYEAYREHDYEHDDIDDDDHDHDEIGNDVITNHDNH